MTAKRNGGLVINAGEDRNDGVITSGKRYRTELEG